MAELMLAAELAARVGVAKLVIAELAEQPNDGGIEAVFVDVALNAIGVTVIDAIEARARAAQLKRAEAEGRY